MDTMLILLILVPLLSAIGVALIGAKQPDAVRWAALASTLVSLVMCVCVATDFASRRYEGESKKLAAFAPVYETDVPLIPLERESQTDAKPGAVHFHIGLDGISVWLVVLTNLLMVASVLCSWKSVTERLNEYFAWMLILQMAMVGVFLSWDVILFYVFFELTLVPLFFLIGIWGGPQRQYAARKFFVFTLAGSLITLLGVLGLVLIHYTESKVLTFSITELTALTQNAMAKDPDKWLTIQWWVFAAMMVGLSVKVPLLPVHTWLPLAHVEAPTAGSVLLAGVLLKLGTYGFLRLCLPLTPDACVSLGAPLLGTLAAVGVVYGAFCALMQDDFKKMIAYSSVSHLGLCMVGLFALNEVGLMGSLLQMVNHGLSTGALFLLVGMLYERYHTRKIAEYGGMAARLKVLAFFMVFMTMSSIALPGLNGFASEFMSLAAMFGSKVPTINGVALASFATLGVILGAWYMLSLLRDIYFGPLKEPHHEGHVIPDMTGREIATLVPIAVLCVVIGLFPATFTKVAEPEINYVAGLTRKAEQRKVAAVEKAEAEKTAALGE
jgi:NADH-quinone oxidoreductase subunit M